VGWDGGSLLNSYWLSLLHLAVGFNGMMVMFLQVAIVQLCTEMHGITTIWLLHIARIGFRVPQELAALLRDPDILKGGRNVGGDLARLVRLNHLRSFEGAFEVGRNASARRLIPDGYAT
jgi:hypothetical protein